MTPDAPVRPDFAGRRLHIVTGKGGTGKTTTAAALALTLASTGRRVLLAEVEGRQSISHVLDLPPLAQTEERLLRVADGGEVWGIAVDAEAALVEYLRLFYRLGAAGGVLRRLGAIDFATTIAPGVRDVLLIGKVYEAVNRADAHARPVYDAVVLDAPPTGRVGRFLGANHEVAKLATAGPIHTQAESITRLLRSERCVVHIVTLLEEMPVQETLEAVVELRTAQFPVGSVIVNQARDQVLGDDALGALAASTLGAELRGRVADDLRGCGLAADDATVDALLGQAEAHVARLAAEDEQFAALDAAGVPVLVMPQLPGQAGAAGAHRLAHDLAAQARW